MRDEFQQQIIEDSVVIDEDLGQAIAYLAFISDPNESIGENHHIAVRRLKNVCNKYSNVLEVKDMILKGFQKLVDRGHIIMLDDLSTSDSELIPGFSFQISDRGGNGPPPKGGGLLA